MNLSVADRVGNLLRLSVDLNAASADDCYRRADAVISEAGYA